MRLTTLVFGVTATLAGAAVATAAVKPETAIHYRQSVYTMIGWNFGPMAQMVKGKTAWDATEFSKHAERIAALTPQLWKDFRKVPTPVPRPKPSLISGRTWTTSNRRWMIW